MALLSWTVLVVVLLSAGAPSRGQDAAEAGALRDLVAANPSLASYWVGNATQACAHNWTGLTCSPNGLHVVAWQWQDALTVLPASFAQLSYLTALSLFTAQVSTLDLVPVCALSGLTSLSVMNYAMNGPIPDCLGSLLSLTTLFLTFDGWTGAIPASLGNLTSLRVLDLSNNQLSGPLPTSMQALVALVVLDLRQNELSGQVPDWIGNLALTSLDLSENDFTGPLPASFTLLWGLDTCSLTLANVPCPLPALPPACSQGSALECRPYFLPSDEASALDDLRAAMPFLPSLWTGAAKLACFVAWPGVTCSQYVANVTAGTYTASVVALDLCCLNMFGSLPPSVALFRNLARLDVHANTLSGPVPSSLASMAALEQLFLDSNQFNGSVPTELGSIAQLRDLDLSHNDFTGAVPTSLAALHDLASCSLAAIPFACPIPLLNNSCDGTATCVAPAPRGISRAVLVGAVVSAVVGTLLLVALLLAAVYGWKYARRRWRRADLSLEVEAAVGMGFHEIEYSELAVEEKVIGRGAFGCVRQARYRGVLCAVKTFEVVGGEFGGGPSGGEIVAEMRALAAVSHHPNIVLMIGVCLEPPALVLEYIASGSLAGIIRNRPAELTTERAVAILRGTAAALNFLHLHRPAPVLHRDLKSANVLVTTSWEPKVCDFGLAKMLTASTMTVQGGTARYMAPEIVAKAEHFATPADVYSFAVVVFECLAKRIPFSTLRFDWEVIEAVRHGGRPALDEVPATAPPFLVALMQRCWHSEPAARPAFAAIVDEFERNGSPSTTNSRASHRNAPVRSSMRDSDHL